jgi:hypothetical protein
MNRTLTTAQEDGLACVVCNTDWTVNPVPNVPVGRVDGVQVFACRNTCEDDGLEAVSS